MKRRATTAAKASKAQQRNKRGHSGGRSSGADLRKQLQERTRELAEARKRLRQRTDDLSEALEQQTATSEVLGVISSSPGELEPVFKAMLENATRICEAEFGTLFRFDGELLHVAASTGTRDALVDYQARRGPFRPLSGTLHDRVFQTKQVVHSVDAAAEPNPGVSARLGGARSTLIVPMLKDEQLIGTIVVYRVEVRPFSEKQIDLVKNFAAQAVIAIENARLLNELRRRTDDLTESLEQQTATSEVLSVISGSRGELKPVFDAMLENATRICGAKFGNLFLYKDGALHMAAAHNTPPGLVEVRQRMPFQADARVPAGRVIKTKQVVHIADLMAEQVYLERDPMAIAAVELGGVRSLLVVPMLKEQELIGTFHIFRQEVKPFTDKQIELVKNFAAQAVIAIENARLLNELRHRTDDLSEALEQQTATSEVLQVISSSPGELEPVFQAMLENAVKLCEAKFGVLYRFRDDEFHPVASVHVPAPYAEFLRSGPFRPLSDPTLSGTPLHRLLLSKNIVQSDDELEEFNPGPAAKYGGARSLIAVPLRKDDEIVGAYIIYRTEVRPFSDKQIELVQNFAAQAVIAIENTRLLNELRESLQQQTATADVLKVISRSTFDLQAVLDTLVGSAARLCEADMATIVRLQGSAYQHAASSGLTPEIHDYMKTFEFIPGRSTVAGRAALMRDIVQVTDVLTDPEYILGEAVKKMGARTIVGVPLLREGIPIGIIVLIRRTVRPFTEREIGLVTTFADQAVIAIENVRLFESVEARTRELAKSLEDLRTAQDRLVQTEKLASLGQLTAGIAHEIKNPLNFVNNFSAVSVELIDELREALAGAHLDSKLRAEIGEIADMLQGNLDKVVQHGKRADTIVKNMLLHSRQGSGEHRSVDINALVEESLNLAYHGARAEKQGFNITIEKSFDPAAGEVDLFPQEITRVLLNLISNGFYATTKRKAVASGGNYEPILAAATKNLGDSVEISIRDNGTGIPPQVREKMFNPFFTTKPAGEGTGLGLSISHDIVVKQHGGSIEVDTRPGEFTEFRIVLPREGAHP